MAVLLGPLSGTSTIDDADALVSSTDPSVSPSSLGLSAGDHDGVDGKAALRFTPEELVSRLVAIVPPAGANQIVYRGVLAGNAALRAEIVPKVEQAPGPPGVQVGPLTKAAKGPGRRPRATWTQLVWRVFKIRGWHCPKCGAKMEPDHVMEGGPTTKRVLAGLIRAAAPP